MPEEVLGVAETVVADLSEVEGSEVAVTDVEEGEAGEEVREEA